MTWRNDIRHVPCKLLCFVHRLVKTCFNLVSLESDLSVSEAYVSQSLGHHTAPNPIRQTAPGLASPSSPAPGPAGVQVRNVGCSTYMVWHHVFCTVCMYCSDYFLCSMANIDNHVFLADGYDHQPSDPEDMDVEQPQAGNIVDIQTSESEQEDLGGGVER